MRRNDIDLDVDTTSDAARRLADCGAELLNALQAASPGLEKVSPWGRDELGQAFARRYSDAAAQVLDVWRVTAERTMELGAQVSGAARATEETDRITSEVIDSLL